jgi:hypothetical protein
MALSANGTILVHPVCIITVSLSLPSNPTNLAVANRLRPAHLQSQ